MLLLVEVDRLGQSVAIAVDVTPVDLKIAPWSGQLLPLAELVGLRLEVSGEV